MRENGLKLTHLLLLLLSSLSQLSLWDVVTQRSFMSGTCKSENLELSPQRVDTYLLQSTHFILHWRWGKISLITQHTSVV